MGIRNQGGLSSPRWGRFLWAHSRSQFRHQLLVGLASQFRDQFFQRLTNSIGYPKLREHLGAGMAIMKLSGDWVSFRKNLDRLYPRHDELPLGFASDDEDDGKGL